MIEQGPESGKFTVSELCSRFSPNNSKSMEQRIRRAVNAGLTNLANMGLEDYSNDTFHDLAGTLYSLNRFLQGDGLHPRKIGEPMERGIAEKLFEFADFYCTN